MWVGGVVRTLERILFLDNLSTIFFTYSMEGVALCVALMLDCIWKAVCVRINDDVYNITIVSRSWLIERDDWLTERGCEAGTDQEDG